MVQDGSSSGGSGSSGSGIIDEAALMKWEDFPPNPAHHAKMGGPGLWGPFVHTVSSERRQRALARMLWNMRYLAHPLHDPTPLLLAAVRSLLDKQCIFRSMVGGANDHDGIPVPRTTTIPVTDHDVDALVQFLHDIGRGLHQVASGMEAHHVVAQRLSCQLSILGPFLHARTPPNLSPQMVVDLRVLLLRWCAREVDVAFNMEMAGLGMYYMDRVLASAHRIDHDKDMLTWVSACTLLAARFERDDMNRSMDASGFPYAQLSGWHKKPTEVIEHAFIVLFFDILKVNADRQHVFRFMALYRKFLATDKDTWMACLYLATSSYLIQELARGKASHLAMQCCLLGSMLTCSTPNDALVQHARSVVWGGDASTSDMHTRLAETAQVYLAHRPNFLILHRLFPTHAKWTATAMADKWTVDNIQRWTVTRKSS